MALPDITITELQNALKIVPASADDVQVIIGCSSQGPSQTPAAYASIPGLVADFGQGPLVEEAALSILQSQGTPVIVIRTPSSTPGGFGTPDVSRKTGTVVIATSGTPYDAYEAYLTVVNGGTIGTSGITFQWSLDDGRTLSAITSLGTAESFTIPNSGANVLFEPPAGSLVAAATEARADALAHFNNATVHDAADAAAIALITLAAPTTNAEAWAVLNQVATAYAAHRQSTTAHNSADTTNVVTTAAATSAQTGISLFINYKAAWNAHLANAIAHNSADTTNPISAVTPARGTLVSGDVVTVRTTAPNWSTQDITDAFTALTNGQQDFGFIQVVGPMSKTEAAVVATGLDGLRAAHKYVWALVGARAHNTNETEAQWMAALDVEWSTLFRSDMAVCAGTWRVTSAISGRQYTRPITGSVAARMVRIPIYVDAAKVAVGPLSEGTLFDANRNRIGHDESKALGLDAARFITLRTFPTRGPEIYITNPKLMSAAGSDFDLVQKRRVMNVLERTIYNFGLTFDLNAEGTADPETGFISETAARDLEEEMRAAIRQALGAAISNPDAEQLFILSRTDPVLTNGGVLNASSRIEPLFYIKNLKVTAGFSAGAGG